MRSTARHRSTESLARTGVGKALWATSLLLGVLWPPFARAYRPFNSTDAAVAGRGELEIECGPVGWLAEGPERSLVAPSLILNWGFAEAMEMVLEGRQFLQLGNNASEPRLRVEDTALSLKRVLREGTIQDKTGFSIATEIGALLPTINGEPGAGAEGAVIVSQRWTDLTVHLNGAVGWTRAHRLGLFGGLIIEAHDVWALRPVAELFVEEERDAPVVLSGLAGAIWRAQENLSLDTALRLARAGGVRTTEIRAGVTWAFEVGFPHSRSEP